MNRTARRHRKNHPSACWPSRLRPLAVAVAIAFTSLVLTSSSAASSGTLTITNNTTLTEDHQGSIVVDADGVTLDCAGHRVSGSGDFGILLNGRSGVTVMNCDVAGFQHGVGLLGSSGNTITQNHSHDNTLAGFALSEGASNVLSWNTADANGAHGFQISQSDGNLFAENHATTNHSVGFALGGSDENRFVENVAAENGLGFQLVFSFNNRLDHNVLRRNTGHALVLDDSSGNELLSNNAVDSGEAGFVLVSGSSANTLTNNVAVRNSSEGFVLVGVSENTLTMNRAMTNDVGFAAFGSTSNSFNQNVACANTSVDAFDDGGPGANSWQDNHFCTSSGI